MSIFKNFVQSVISSSKSRDTLFEEIIADKVSTYLEEKKSEMANRMTERSDIKEADYRTVKKPRVSKDYAVTIHHDDEEAVRRFNKAKEKILKTFPGKFKIAKMGRGHTDAGKAQRYGGGKVGNVGNTSCPVPLISSSSSSFTIKFVS